MIAGPERDVCTGADPCVVRIGTGPPFWQINHANSACYRLFLGYFGVISASRPPFGSRPPPFLHILDPPLCLQIFHRGCVEFKWSFPFQHMTSSSSCKFSNRKKSQVSLILKSAIWYISISTTRLNGVGNGDRFTSVLNNCWCTFGHLVGSFTGLWWIVKNP